MLEGGEGSHFRYFIVEETDWCVSFKKRDFGAPGWCSRLSVQLQPGHDLAVREFEPCIGLWADGSEPGACFRFCVSLSLPLPRSCSVSLCPKNKTLKKKIKKKKTRIYYFS